MGNVHWHCRDGEPLILRNQDGGRGRFTTAAEADLVRVGVGKLYGESIRESALQTSLKRVVMRVRSWKVHVNSTRDSLGEKKLARSTTPDLTVVDVIRRVHVNVVSPDVPRLPGPPTPQFSLDCEVPRLYVTPLEIGLVCKQISGSRRNDDPAIDGSRRRHNLYARS